MMMNRNILIFILLVSAFKLVSQISAGKITYERKTNLYKKMKGGDVKNWIKEADKIKTDYFELFFNDTCFFCHSSHGFLLMLSSRLGGTGTNMPDYPAK